MFKYLRRLLDRLENDWPEVLQNIRKVQQVWLGDSEDATEGGGRTGHIGQFLSRNNTGGAVVRGGDVGAFGANGAEAGSILCGFPATGDKY